MDIIKKSVIPGFSFFSFKSTEYCFPYTMGLAIKGAAIENLK